MTKKKTFWAAAKVVLTTIGITIATYGALFITSIALVTKEIIKTENRERIYISHG